MITTITVYGTDINLCDANDCKNITYDVISGEGNSSELYWNLAETLVVFEMMSSNKFGNKAMMGIDDGKLSMQIDITDDILIFKVPINATSLDMNNFELGTYKIGEVIMPRHNREQLVNIIREFTHNEFQYYLNTMMKIKKGSLVN